MADAISTYFSAAWNTIGFWRKFSHSPIYLHPILMLAAIKKYTTLFVMVIGLALIAFFLKQLWLFILATALLITGLLSERWHRYIVKYWILLAKTLGWLNSRIILTLIFYLIIFPYSVILKFTRKSPIKTNSNRQSFYKTLNRTIEPKHFENPW